MAYILKLFTIICILQLSRSAHLQDYKCYDNYKLYEVTGERKALLELINFMQNIDEDVAFKDMPSGSVEILVAPEYEHLFNNMLEKKYLKKKILINDFSEIIKAEKQGSRRKGYSWDAYYDVNNIYEYLQTMSKTYPEWTELVVGGQSYEGRQILGLRINTPKENIGSKGAKPAMFIESGIHAREWITPATTTYFINQLLTSNDPNITALRDDFDWHIFPTVNPDGYHYSFTRERMWRKTRSRSENGCYGADPNRNWDHNWGNYSSSSNPCDYQTYAGSKPFSEIETRTLSEYISNVENLLGYIAFHSYAQVLLLPYSDSEEHLDNYDDLYKIGKTSLEYGYQVNKEQYDGPGTAAEVLYKASGGSMDWVRNSLGTSLVYTYELRGFYFHWPPSRIPEQGDEVTQMMVGLAAGAKDLGYY